MDPEKATISDVNALMILGLLKERQEILLKAGVNIETLDASQCAPLHMACAMTDNEIDIVGLLLEESASIDFQDSNGKTPLHYASAQGNVKIVQILLKNGAKTDITDNTTTEGGGDTALHLAINFNYTVIVETLLTAGADVNAKNKLQSTPLHNAAELGNCEIAEKLIQFGANINSQDELERTPLHLSSGKGYFEFVSMLINRGADLEIKSGLWLLDEEEDNIERDEPIEGTALNFAVWFNQPHVVEILIKSGANIEECADEGTSLHIAALKNNCKMINVLVLFGAKIDSECESLGRTPLHTAVYNGNIQAAKTLLNLGANIEGKGSYGITPLHFAASQNSYSIAQLLLYLGAEVDSLTEDGLSPLHEASQYGNLKIMSLLLDYGANINAITALDYWRGGSSTPLHLAVKRNGLEAAKLLINAGADMYVKDSNGRGLLHMVAGVDNLDLDIAKFLLNFHHDVDAKDFTGKTPLHTTAEFGNLNFSFILTALGADINILSGESLTALDYARRSPATRRCFIYLSSFVTLLKSVNMNLCEKLLNDVKVNALAEMIMENEYNEALAKLKITKIGNSNITFYNLLGKSVNRLAVTLNSDEIRESISLEACSEFSGYQFIMRNHFEKGLKRKTVVDLAISKWYEIFPRLPYECVAEILSYFSCEDLEQFIDLSQ